MIIDWKVTSVYEKNLKAILDNKVRVIINQGGSRSSKTYSIVQLLIMIAYANKNINISIVADTLPHLKRSALKHFLDIMKSSKLYRDNRYNKSDLIYTFSTGSTIEFFSCENFAKVTGSGRDILFANEANSLLKNSLFQLVLRTEKKIILDYNPYDFFHYIYDDYIPREDAILIKSTFRDNPFLPQSQLTEFDLMEKTDPISWKIWGLGEIANLGNLIFGDNIIIHSEPFPDDDYYDDISYGLDFGHTDPTTFMKIGIKENELYISQLLYESGLTTPNLIAKIQDLKPIAGKSIYGDNSRPEIIKEMTYAGLYVLPSIKGSGSVRAGLMLMKIYKIHLRQQDYESVREFKCYKWKQNPKDGKIIDGVPVPFNDHSIDAVRYGIYSHIKSFPKIGFTHLRF